MDALDMLARLDNGYFAENLDAELQTVAEAVLLKAQRSGQPNVKGKVTVTFDVVHFSGAEPTVLILPSFKKGMPSREAGGLQFFLHDSEFHMSDPRQPALNVRVVETPVGEARPTPAGDPAPAREVSE